LAIRIPQWFGVIAACAARFDRCAIDRICCRLIDRGEVVKGDEAVDREFASDKQIDQIWDELVGPAVSLGDAAHSAARLQCAHLKPPLGALPDAADENAGAAAALDIDEGRIQHIFGDRGTVGQHHGDRLADVANLSLRNDRLMIGDEARQGLKPYRDPRHRAADVGRANDSVHSGDCPCCSGVDRANAPCA
jgi:hypothetical protein